MKLKKLNQALLIPLLVIMLFGNSSIAQSNLDLTQAVNNSDRPEGDKARDAARQPEQVLEFIGIEPEMTVMDVMAGGGYYTELLAAAVGAQGNVISHNFEWGLQMRQGSAAASIKDKSERYSNIEKLVVELAPVRPPESLWSRVDPAPWPVDLGPFETDPNPYWGNIDVVFLGLNLHDMYVWNDNKEQSADKLLAIIFRFLKPGGVLGLTEHRGVKGNDNNTLHRMTDETVRRFLTQAGFIVEAESNALANPLDDHSKFIFDQSLGRNTDRMLIRARKPN